MKSREGDKVSLIGDRHVCWWQRRRSNRTVIAGKFTIFRAIREHKECCYVTLTHGMLENVGVRMCP